MSRPPEYNKEKLEDLLKKLRAVNSDVIGSAIVTIDGSPIVSILDLNVDPALTSAITASIHAFAERAVSELSRGKLTRVLVECEYGDIILSKAGIFLLCVLTKPEASLGMLFLNIQSVKKEIELFSFEAEPEAVKVNRAIMKTLSMMNDENKDTLSLEKQYLLELLSKVLLNYNTLDGLPIVKESVKEQFSQEGIVIRYDGHKVIFYKV